MMSNTNEMNPFPEPLIVVCGDQTEIWLFDMVTQTKPLSPENQKLAAMTLMYQVPSDNVGFKESPIHQVDFLTLAQKAKSVKHVVGFLEVFREEYDWLQANRTKNRPFLKSQLQKVIKALCLFSYDEIFDED
jgi:hypothetical protein